MTRRATRSAVNFKDLQRAQRRAGAVRTRRRRSLTGPALAAAAVVVCALIGVGIFGGGDASAGEVTASSQTVTPASDESPTSTSAGSASDTDAVAATDDDGSDDDAARENAETANAASGSTTVVSEPEDQSAGTALAALATLPVKGRAAKTGYARTEMFGQAWLDIDRNGCDTRNDILQRDLVGPVLSGPCKVMSGTLNDPFTAQTIGFVRGNDTSALVQIDHVVALSDAWQKGAQQLTQDQRVALANDPLNLLAVDGTANQQKSDGDAATWLPANKSFRCDYIARQVSVKAAYGLWVTDAEGETMRRVLETCPDQPAFAPGLEAAGLETAGASNSSTGLQAVTAPNSSTAAPVQIADTPASEAPASTPPAADVYYKNCTAARAAGAAPVSVGQPGYGTHLDRDGDGIGCE